MFLFDVVRTSCIAAVNNTTHSCLELFLDNVTIYRLTQNYYIMKPVTHILEIREYKTAKNYKERLKLFTDLKAATEQMFLIREIYPNAESWLWETSSWDEEIRMASLLCHCTAKAIPETEED